MNVLHILDHSLPIQSGYAFRSESILHALRAKGIAQAVLTSPKHPAMESDNINGIRYDRSWRGPVREGVAGQVQCVLHLSAAMKRAVGSERPHVIHVHSPCLNGLAAIRARAPLVYEIRSSWEDAAVSIGKTREGSLRYRASAMLETLVAKHADQVVLLCDSLLEEFARRGIPRAKMTVIGNAIDRSSFRPPDTGRVAWLRERYQLEGKIVLGFYGSYFSWEGLESLIEAVPLMLLHNDKIAVVLAGGGEQEAFLMRLVEENGLSGRVHFVGRVDHRDIPDYYGLADIMVFPRRSVRIAELVTPLKPLEAMHFGCLVAASDVGGHRALIEHGKTGILFPPNDPRALAEAVLATIADPLLARNIRNRADAYLNSERTWDRMAERYLDVYGRAIAAEREGLP